MAIIYVLIAACFAATVNFCLRKNLQYTPSSKGFLTLYFVFSLVSSFLVNPHISFAHFNYVMSAVGVSCGLLNFIMILLLARAVKIGPSGLTFAFQNSACILPALLLFFIFGRPFGFNLSLLTMLGFLLILTGLFISSRSQKNQEPTGSTVVENQYGKWLVVVITTLVIQGVILALFQWRSLLLTEQASPHLLIPWTFPAEHDAWVMPSFFFIPTILQALIFWYSEKRWFSSTEILLGIIAGLFNGAATFFLLLATKSASGFELVVLFPLFAVSVIFLCNLWGKWLFQEKTNWLGMSLCFAGVLLSAF